ncbi:sodium:solute symporter family protein [Planctomicrobium sp. SH664]|uniref:sodium:solute symporter family protein n=1 Tax=Planctomicrobium sp. SH664 TaxID=3448125 RepID=UPI003F5BE897
MRNPTAEKNPIRHESISRLVGLDSPGRQPAGDLRDRFFSWLRQKDLGEFFLAGRSMPFAIVAISLFATLFSTISFVGVPAEAYQNGILTSLTSFGYALFTPLAVWLFLRYFFQSKETFTAYEYLERRFNVSTRVLGALTFLFARALFGATVICAGTRILKALLNVEPEVTVLIIGIAGILFSTFGGMRGMMLTDALQTLMVVVTLVAIILRVGWLIDFDLGSFYRYVVEHDRVLGKVTTPEFYSFDPHTRYTLWVWLFISLTMPLQQYGTDQLVVQRFLASRSYRDAKKAIVLKTIITPMFILSLFFIGLLMFYYYSTAGTLPENLPADQVMGHFMLTQLPSPLPGLIVAGLVADLISSLAASVGSLSTVTCVDLLKQVGWLPQQEQQQVRLGRGLSVAWGVLLVGVACLLISLSSGITTMIFEMANVLASLWGVLLVVMLAGVLTRWATATGATAALAVGLCLNLTLPFYLYFGFAPADRISFAWTSVPGMLATALTLGVVSYFDPARQKRTSPLGERAILSTADRPE